MREENPNALPERIQHIVDDMQAESGKKIDAIVERHDRSSERYVDAMKIFERAAAGESELLTKLQVALDAEVRGKRSEYEQRIIDAALFVIEKFGNPYADGKSVSRDELIVLCKRAFDALAKEPYGYFEER